MRQNGNAGKRPSVDRQSLIIAIIQIALLFCLAIGLLIYLWQRSAPLSFASAVDKNKLETLTGLRFPDDAVGNFTVEGKPIPLAIAGRDDRLFVAKIETSNKTIDVAIDLSGLPPLEPLGGRTIVCGDQERDVLDWWFPPEVLDLSEREYTCRRESGYYTLIACGHDKNGEYVMYVVRTNKRS